MLCKNPNCNSPILSSQPFCRKCWAKNFTGEELRHISNKVKVVKTLEDLGLVANKAETFKVGIFILVEGELSQQVSKAFNARSKVTERWIKAAGAGTAALLSILLASVLKDKIESDNSKMPEWGEIIDHGAPLINSLTVGAVGVGATLYGANEANNSLPNSDLVDKLYKVGFKVQVNRGEYIVLERLNTNREKTKMWLGSK